MSKRKYWKTPHRDCYGDITSDMDYIATVLRTINENLIVLIKFTDKNVKMKPGKDK